MLQKYPQQYCNVPETCKIVGKITGLNSATPTIVLGKGYTVTKDATGVYGITVDSPFRAAVTIPFFGASSATALRAQNAGYDTATKKVSVRLVNDSSAATDGGATDTIDFEITLFLSGLPLK